MTFTDDQQAKHRAAFIDGCRQNAWSARCNASWIEKQMQEHMAQWQRLSDQRMAVLKEIDATKAEPHTKDRYDKQKQLEARASELQTTMDRIDENTQRGHKAIQEFVANVQSNLAMAEHAATWEWPQPAQVSRETEGATLENDGSKEESAEA